MTMQTESRKYQRVASRLLTEQLFDIGMEYCDTISDKDGKTCGINKIQKLARVLWDAALGTKTKTVDGKLKTELPKQWAITEIFNRIDGRVMPQMAYSESEDTNVEESNVDSIEQLHVGEINALSD